MMNAEELVYVCMENACPCCGADLNEITSHSTDGFHVDGISASCRNLNCELSCGFGDEDPN